MRKLFLFVIVILFIILVTGCMTYNNLNIKQINTFKKELKATHKEIKRIEIKYSAPSLYFMYSLKKGTEDEMFDIFYETQELILNKDFQEKFFDKFFNTYFNEDKASGEKYYPSIYIDFDLNNDRSNEYAFYSMYYKQPYNSGRKNEVDGYKTWIYWDSNNESKPVPEKEEKNDPN